MKRALVITCNAPSQDPASCTHGTYQRFAALLAAIAPIVDRVEVLALYRPVDLKQITVSADELEAYYRSYAGVDARVKILVSRSEPADRPSRLGVLHAGLVDPYGTRSPPWQHSPGFDHIELMPDGFAFVIAHRLASYSNLRHFSSVRAPVLLDLDDVEHRAAYRLWRMPPRYLGKLFESGRILGLARLEREASRRCATTFVCSELDRKWMERVLRARHVEVLPNSVDSKPDLGPAPESRVVLFVGVLGYEPNADAVRWLMREIWPQVLADMPGATLRIVGRVPPGNEHGLVSNHTSIQFLGFVENLDAEYSGAQVVVCPIRAGGGTRIKIIEAAMYGRAVVSTSIGAEGLAFEAPAEICIANDSRAFAREVTRLLGNTGLCDQIAARSRARAKALYSRSGFQKIVQSCALEAMANTGTH